MRGGRIVVKGDKETCERCDMLATLAKASPELHNELKLILAPKGVKVKDNRVRTYDELIKAIAARMVELYRLVKEADNELTRVNSMLSDEDQVIIDPLLDRLKKALEKK